MKTCRGCSTPKETSEFPRDSRSKDGFSGLCKVCMAAKNKAAYIKHAEKRKAHQREYNTKDRAAKSEYNKRYREANREKLVQASRDWRAAGNKTNRSSESVARYRAAQNLRYQTDSEYRERVKAYAVLYRKNNPKKVAAAAKIWRANNIDTSRKYNREYQRAFNQTPEGKASQAAMRVKHRAARQAARSAYFAKRYGESGVITNEHLNWLHKWQDHCCCYCNVCLNGKETIEHIVPLSRGGENNPHNVLLACSTCNTSKNKRLFDDSEWVPESVVGLTKYLSAFVTKIASSACFDADIGNVDSSGRIALKNGRYLQVLSSFWMSDRSDNPVKIESLHRDYPTDLLTFDYEWLEHPQALLNVVKAKAGAADSVMARSLTVESPDMNTARDFMNTWHVQGFAGGSWYVGLRNEKGEWVGIASFRRMGSAYELARLAFKGHVTGGLSRIITAFMRSAPEKGDLFTYADTRFGDGGGYSGATFESVGETVASYGYVNSVSTHSRQSLRKDQMATRLDFFDPDWTEHRLARVNGLWRLNSLPQRRFLLRA